MVFPHSFTKLPHSALRAFLMHERSWSLLTPTLDVNLVNAHLELFAKTMYATQKIYEKQILPESVPAYPEDFKWKMRWRRPWKRCRNE
jgi:hypothetical protein